MSDIVDLTGRKFPEKVKAFELHLTNHEMQHVSAMVRAYMDIMNEAKIGIPEVAMINIVSAMLKFKEALKSNKYKIVQDRPTIEVVS